jgi:YD repeat-containing protein
MKRVIYLFCLFAILCSEVYGSDWGSVCFEGTEYYYAEDPNYWTWGGYCVIKLGDQYMGSVGCARYLYKSVGDPICCLACPQDLGPGSTGGTKCAFGAGCYDTAGFGEGTIFFNNDIRDQKEEICGNGIDDNCNGETDENCKCDPSRGDQDCCERGQGDEVDIISGRMFLDHRRPMVLEGVGKPIEFEYGYSEGKGIWMEHNNDTGDMGYGWYFSYADRLVFGPEYTSLIRADGVVEGFRKEINGYMVPTGKYHRLVEVNGEYRIIEPDGSYTVFSGTDGRMLKKVDSAGNEIEFRYYGIDTGEEGCEIGIYGKLCKVKAIDNREIRFQYNGAGLLISVNAPSGNTITLDYQNGRLVSVSDNLGLIESYEYVDVDTNQDSVADATVLGVVKDSYGGIKEFWEYDNRGKAVRDWRVDTDLYFDYDPDNDPETPDGTLVYDAKNNTTRHYRYHLGRITSVDGGDMCGGKREYGWEYDGVLKLMKYSKDGEGRRTDYVYDNRGNVIEEKRWAEYGDPNNYYLVRYSYQSEMGIRTGEEKDGSVLNPSSQEYIGVIYDYDSDYDNEFNESPGTLLTQVVRYGYTYSDLSGSNQYVEERTRYYYDSYGRLIRIDGPRDDVADEVIYEYYPLDGSYNSGKLKSVNRGGEITTYENYNYSGKPERVVNPDGGVIEYIYDIRGRLVQMRVYNGDRTEITENYYDNDNRLIYTRLPEGNYIVYEYYTDTENNGRIKAVIKSESYPYSTYSERIEYEYYPNGQKKLEIYKDGSGGVRMKMGYAYDYEGRMKKVYIYTNNESNPTYMREYFYDRSGNLIRIADENNAVRPVKIFVSEIWN